MFSRSSQRRCRQLAAVPLHMFPWVVFFSVRAGLGEAGKIRGVLVPLTLAAMFTCQQVLPIPVVPLCFTHRIPWPSARTVPESRARWFWVSSLFAPSWRLHPNDRSSSLPGPKPHRPGLGTEGVQGVGALLDQSACLGLEVLCSLSSRSSGAFSGWKVSANNGAVSCTSWQVLDRVEIPDSFPDANPQGIENRYWQWRGQRIPPATTSDRVVLVIFFSAVLHEPLVVSVVFCCRNPRS